MVFERNPTLPADVFEFVETLPSIPTPDVNASPLRRAKHLVKLLADDANGPALLPDAGAQLTKKLNSRLDGLYVEHAEQVSDGIADLHTAVVSRQGVTIAGQDLGSGSRREIETDIKDLERDARRIVASVKEGVGKDWLRHRVEQAGDDADVFELRVQCAALLRIPEVIEKLEATATEFVKQQLARFDAEIKNTTGATRDAYRKVQEQTTAPEALTIELRDNEKAATKYGSGEHAGEDLPTYERHLYASADGRYPVELGSWERHVLEAELSRASLLAWYRNPSRATPNSLRIAYQDDAGRWTSLQVDFLFIARRDDGSLGAAIVDPHGDHLADAKRKLLALADFAEQHGERFTRIQSVAKGSDGSFRALDLLEPGVREAVRQFPGAKVSAMYDSEFAIPYQ